MQYLILNGMKYGDSLIPKITNSLSEKLQNKNLQGEILNLHSKDIKPCLGCFKCWVETPGICIIDDYGREVAKKTIQSDYLIYITPVNYGGYSAELKKAVDRSLPLLSPFFRVYHEEIHHEMRYDKYPDFIVIGTLEEPNEEQEEIFKKLVQRNSLNNFAEQSSSQIIYSSDAEETIETKIEESLSIIGGNDD
ncbi:MAG: flavodoxin family protein [Candidatus Heimdallarchaeota archaeon]|nr:flavodoxin family protein [Candidatus Heimdallarchaeota archaeon]